MLKILALIIGSLVLLLAAALLAVVLLVDPNDYKDDITAAVRDATGRELTLSGDIELSVFPWLGLSLGETSLGNAPGFGEAPMARVAAVDIKVKLLPLLARRVEMKTVRLHGLRMNLQRAQDGRTNWQDLLAAPQAAEKPVAPKAAEAPGIAAIAIGGVELLDARIEWDDRLAGQRVLVDKLALRTGTLAPPSPVDISLDADITLDQPALQSHVNLTGRVTADFDQQHFRVDGMELALEARGSALPLSPLNARLNTTVDALLAQGQIDIVPLKLQIAGLTLNGKARIKGLDATPMLTGQVAVETFSLRKLAKDMSIALPATTDAAVLAKAAASLQIEADAAHLDVTQLTVTLDDTNLTGNVEVRNYEQPALRFDLKLDALDADRYLPPPAAPAAASAAAAAAPAPAALPLDMMRALDINGQLHAGKLTVAKAHLADVSAALKAKDGKLRLHPATAKLYNGNFSGDIGLDVRGATPSLTLEEQLTGVQVGPLLKDMFGKESVLGSAEATAKLAAQGLELDGIINTLDGQARVEFKNGAVKGINIGQLLREAYAKLKKLPPPPKSEEQTDFADLSASVVIAKGVVSNRDLKANAPALRVNGEGKVDLPRQRIDYRLTTTLVESLEGQGGEEAADLKGLPIPIKITGSFEKPQFSLDLKPLLEAKAREELEHQKQKLKKEVDKKLDEEKQKAKEKLDQKLKDKLKGLF
jgi:AsmA protein